MVCVGADDLEVPGAPEAGEFVASAAPDVGAARYHAHAPLLPHAPSSGGDVGRREYEVVDHRTSLLCDRLGEGAVQIVPS